MNKKEETFEYIEAESIKEFNRDVQLLYEKAVHAMHKAYAPYSKFKVGAAVLLNNGEIYTGNNQENAAYPSGLCAERIAVFAAKSQFPEAEIEALVVVTGAKNISRPVSPCGGCRQVLLEYEHQQKKPFSIYLPSANESVVCIQSARHLLPFNFDADMLQV